MDTWEIVVQSVGASEPFHLAEGTFPPRVF